MTGRADGLKSILSEMKRVPGVEGAALVTRDGIGALQDLPANAQHESFAAMTAAMLGAAEAALMQIGRKAPQRLIVDAGDARLLLQGVTEQLLLVVIASPTTNISSLDTPIRVLVDQAKRLQ